MTAVLIAYRSRAKGGAEILGVAEGDLHEQVERERIDLLMAECERVAHLEYSKTRRLYGDVPSLDVFGRRFFRWTETSREFATQTPLIACANFGEYAYLIERREPLC